MYYPYHQGNTPVVEAFYREQLYLDIGQQIIELRSPIQLFILLLKNKIQKK